MLDLNLPGMGGWDVFEPLTTEHPEVPVIILTGRADQLLTSLATAVPGG